MTASEPCHGRPAADSATPQPRLAGGVPITYGGAQSRADVLGREEMLRQIEALLSRGHNLHLFGAPDVGKTSLIAALDPRDAVILDPFEDVSPHLAARIRRAMDRGVLHIAASRTLDRARLGAVRRIAWRFTTVRVPPLDGRWMLRIVRAECESIRLSDVVTLEWMRMVVKLSRGRPGLALAVIQAASTLLATKGNLPSPAVAYIAASIARSAIAVPASSEAVARRPRP